MLDGYIQRFLELIGAKQPTEDGSAEQQKSALSAKPTPRPNVDTARTSPPRTPPSNQAPKTTSAVVNPSADKPRPPAQSAHVAVSVSARAPSSQLQPTKGKSKVVSAEVLAKILNVQWDVLTAPGAKAELSRSQIQYIALLSSPKDKQNTLIIADGFQMHPETSAARSHLRRRGESWVHEFVVELPVIRQVYQRAGVVADLGVNSGSAQRGKDFLDLITSAAAVNSSDMHLTVHEHEATVEIREDGLLETIKHIQSPAALEICMAAFAMADNSDPTYIPLEAQEARVTEASVIGAGLKFPEGVQALRLQFSYLPPGGRYLVARLLYDQKPAVDADVDTLGYARNHIRDLKLMRARPFGVNIVSGPTGSGKSTTLQRLLTALKHQNPGKNIISIEDPPEYLIVGVRQLAITNARTEAERSAAYQKMMNNAMRQDPDYIMVGEVRDGPSAALMFKAAMSGHGVYTTLHTNTASAILDRLRDMGVEAYKLGDASLVTGLIGQRLVRLVNPKYGVTMEEAMNDGLMTEEDYDYLRQLVGKYASQVRFDGAYKLSNPKEAKGGRSIVGETIHPDQTYLDLYFDKGKTKANEYWFEEMDGTTMNEHALTLICQGKLAPTEFISAMGRLQNIPLDRVEKVFKVIGL